MTRKEKKDLRKWLESELAKPPAQKKELEDPDELAYWQTKVVKMLSALTDQKAARKNISPSLVYLQGYQWLLGELKYDKNIIDFTRTDCYKACKILKPLYDTTVFNIYTNA